MLSMLSRPDAAKADSDGTTLLDSHFETVDQLYLDDLLEQARRRHEELQVELSMSHKEVESLLSNTRTEVHARLQSARELSLLRHSVVDDLADLSQELVSNLSLEEKKPTLLEQIETLHRNLKELTSIRGYVQVIEHALSLSENAVKQLQSSSPSISPASINEYRTLQAFVTKVRDSCESCANGSEFQSLHLVTFLEDLESRTWAEMKTVLFTVLLTISEKFGWPMKVNYIKVTQDDRATFENAFHNLLKLQSLGKKIKATKSRAGKDGLYPLQALVQPISLRFKYHFEGTRQTNRIDKPEWYFTHIQNITHDHHVFMETVIQSLLSTTEYAGINAWREFVLLLLPLLSHKLRRTIPLLIPHAPLLAHTIYQALVFDATMREQGFQLGGTSSQQESNEDEKMRYWNGISDVVLGNREWFETWLTGEKKFAKDQYLAIISVPEAWNIVDDEDGEGNRDFKPTTSARQLKALVEQITDRYSPLPDVTQRAHFLATVQLPILDLYRDRIMSSLDAYETLSSAFVRVVPGALSVSFGGREEESFNVDPHKLTGGVNGVQRLCKAFLSAAFLETALESWGEELFFLELWTQMNSDPLLREETEKNPLLPRQVEANRTPTSTVFEELISRYTKVIVRAEDMIVQQVCGEVEAHFKAHLNAVTLSDLETEQSSDVAVSQSLLIPIALLSSHLTFIRSMLPQTTLTSLYRRVASRLAEHILQRQILYRGHFNLQQGKVITAECELWAETCNAALAGRLNGGRYRVDMPWLRLLQAGRLVGLEGDEWLTIRSAMLQDLPGEEWAALMVQITGASELDREQVRNVAERREDY
ncbi:hypothetical protein AX15_000908 [Amanita polypyramis BW_CC]|nr:hypothetical protein AX15_000908 [Amanita polypyramis BW_CC]